MSRTSCAAAAALLVATVFSGAGRPQPASACAIPEGLDPFANAASVIEGRVVYAGHYPDPFVVLVHRVYYGPAALIATFVTSPTSCGLEGTVEPGDYLVIGLYPIEGRLVGTWPTLAYAGPQRAGEEYTRARDRAAARFGAGRPPAVPAAWGGWWAAW